MEPLTAWSGPLCVHREGADTLLGFARDRPDWLADALIAHGAILFRGFDVSSPAALGAAAQALCGPLIDYVYRSTPRTKLDAEVFTATEYRADASIPMHNENSYQRTWPAKLMFCCAQPAAVGGETPLAATGDVTRRLDKRIVETFKAKGVMYVRHYREGLDLDWQTTFQANSQEDIERFCRREGIEWKWLRDGTLRTRQVCHATATHAATGRELWFNQAHLFHPSSLDPDDREALTELCGEDGLPRNAFFGDGTPIDEAMLAEVRDVYASEARDFAWERGDALLVDNMLTAHGRRPFRGERRVLVAMAEPVSDVAVRA